MAFSSKLQKLVMDIYAGFALYALSFSFTGDFSSLWAAP